MPVSTMVSKRMYQSINTACYSIENENSNRRSALSKISSATMFGISCLSTHSLPAEAKAKEPVTAEAMAAAFAAVRKELDDPEGGIAKLGSAIDKKDWTEIKEFTKYYDLEFRKAKMVKARKMFPDKDMKGEALPLCNNVTFDLIGINRAARAEDLVSAMQYYESLKKDVSSFLVYESKVVIHEAT